MVKMKPEMPAHEASVCPRISPIILCKVQGYRHAGVPWQGSQCDLSRGKGKSALWLNNP